MKYKPYLCSVRKDNGCRRYQSKDKRVRGILTRRG